jgi:uncharacterized small protein (DUF1192 family)
MKAMSDIEGLVKDLRAVAYDVYPATRLDAADALEAQAAELTRLREQCEAKDAEIERLKAERGWFEGLVKSHDILERLASLSAENERLKVELKRSEDDNAANFEAAQAECGGRLVAELKLATLSAENERLRKALEDIKEKSSGRYGGGKLLNYIHAKSNVALAVHAGEGEKDGLE